MTVRRAVHVALRVPGYVAMWTALPVPLPFAPAVQVIMAMRLIVVVRMIMAVRVNAIACHMAYRGTPSRLRLSP
ncbi:hypothetical protein [Streptomyces sp. NPDC058773]|uniref:hypothetical protein n=1 Tax=Streptomyces sp. NPDC058773 TaxID=3346632 RepID=UPI003699AA85